MTTTPTPPQALALGELTDERIAEIFASINPDSFLTADEEQRFARAIEAEVRRSPAAHPAVGEAPVATQPQAHGGQYLCYAWGESDWPVAAFAADWSGVRHFIIEQWLGDADAQDYDGTPTLVRLKEEFDAPEWDMVDSLEWTFEIGGVRITKVFDVSATAPPAAPALTEPSEDARKFAWLRAHCHPENLRKLMNGYPGEKPGTPVETTQEPKP
jgi:hypothetical protein